MSPIQIYAELLPNIRQVSVTASFATTSPSSTTTTVDILGDGQTLRIRHAGQCSTLQLPGPVAVKSAKLTLPEGNSRYASWRLPLKATTKTTTTTTTTTTNIAAAAAPWSAPDLPVGAVVACRNCKAAVVPAQKVRVWKDLPSENWAEMMEFWHCHKPDEHRHHSHHGHHGHHDHHDHPTESDKASEEALASRGYGANSAITAQIGVGFVDLVALLFDEADCEGLTFSKSTFDQGVLDRQSLVPDTLRGTTQQQSLNVFCTSCRCQIGYFNLRMATVTLFKWQLQCTSGVQEPRHDPTLSECLAATLMATVARSGSSKSLLMPIYGLPTIAGSSRDKILHLWVLNSNIRYASNSNSSTQNSPLLAIKLLYKWVERDEADAILEKINSDIQEINLPEDAIAAVAEMLQASNALLPAKERLFQGWEIGLLERWEEPSSGGS